ncbi:hypothetical protein LTR84_007345 [Exophiala bonariae]|uniref:NmrA-like domain-containing protein n=1 Tax=Exophiala bonariae TaxID=1690606 RepID=A0AAV9N117_9EURO|nr:hypothetical protein LTR84_007345 [Exophiala bonariae]
MVKIVLAGGTGNLGREILDALIEKGTHELSVFTRSDGAYPDLEKQGVRVLKVNYDDQDGLTAALKGVEVVLSFVVAQSDPEGMAQKNLIDASVAAEVKRFAPSEWASRSGAGPQYASKDIVSDYLREINKDKRVLEYSLFQLGFFTNYLGSPHKTTKHVQLFNIHVDVENRRAIAPEGDDLKWTFTTVQDVARVVAEAVDYQGIWPEIGGVNGHTLTNAELLKIVEEIRGPISIERVTRADLEAGRLNTTWAPKIEHPSIPPEHRTRELSDKVISRTLLAGLKGSWVVSDEWNKLLPHVKFTKVDEFLRSVNWGS